MMTSSNRVPGPPDASKDRQASLVNKILHRDYSIGDGWAKAPCGELTRDKKARLSGGQPRRRFLVSDPTASPAKKK
ncbi:hypothetical protein [Caballeronia humi]|jgi:hypothetical protein|uniref:hypothetical protein n=1 Tax=Caballeronia humi TaxID=326474 RepID=UPI000F749CC2|nr:hypothetical protein [Caballeronia humi]